VKPSKAAWLAPGCRLDRYDLLLQVAEGGMGSLWLARQEGKHGFERVVAIKTILPKLASDPEFRRMFLDEARVVSRIEHPNVAQVLDLGEERGVLFLVMEWIDGDSLINIGRAVEESSDARIPVGVLARIMVDACAGVHAAHELTDDDGLALGVVHRDLSPHNLLVGFSGTTKVIDFGIAKARNRAVADTSVGLLKGKIAYMAPEQALGGRVDRRTDVWSAGASMYRFLAGCTPYKAEDALALLRQLTEGVPPASLPTSVPEPIRGVVEKALARDADNRFETAHEMGARLEKAMRAADVYATREDVAAFLMGLMGGARATRTKDIENAVRESRSRVRVELANAGSATDSTPAPLSSVWEEPIVLESRPPGTARPSGRPTAILLAQPVIDQAAPAPPVARRRRFRLGGSHRAVGWVAGTSLFGALLVVCLAWRALQHPRPVAEAGGAPPANSVSATSTIMGTNAPLGAAGLAPSSPEPVSETVVPSTARLPGPIPVPVPASAHPRDPRASGASPGEATPTDSEVLSGLAEVEAARGNSAQAIATYRRALAVNPRYLPARLGLAAALWTSGQRDEARASYRRIVDEVPPALCPDLARERAAGKG
jgi:serine/threonine protein kinase